MDLTLVYIVLATIFISLGSLVGILTLSLKGRSLNSILLYLVSLSAGTLIGGAFIHLLPEAAETLEPKSIGLITLTSFVSFFFIEKVLHWHHCHDKDCDTHTIGYMNLIADSIHNFIDGLVIAATFVVSPTLGIATTVAIAFHEIPQEIGDFGVLVFSGFSKRKAVVANLAVAATSIAGGIIGFYFSQHIDNIVGYLLPFAAGSFIYIAASDLLPEIKEEESLKNSIISFAIFLFGISIMLLIE